MNALPPPLIHPPRGSLPVVLSVPHAGRDYPDWLLELAGKGHGSLRALEDPYVDRLVWRALGTGVGAVIAQAPRAGIDCNRSEDEIDVIAIDGAGPRRPSARARGGLGIVPSRTAAHGQLWRRPISRAELEHRLESAYRPYHSAVDAQLALTADRFGSALLLDCHSMPGVRGVAQIVFGDRFGRSAAPWIVQEALAAARNAGFTAAANDPFAGGHVLDRHGRPGDEIHALQIEVDRRLYLTPDGEPGADFDAVAGLLHMLVQRLGESLLDRRLPAAAE